jgi:hypothetical protein
MGNWEDLEVKYMWKTRGANCHIYSAMAGCVYTYDRWISAGVLPGFHMHCNCYLSRVAESTPVSSLDVFGSDFDIMLDNHYFLFFNTNPSSLPVSRYMTDLIEKTQKETGLSIGNTMKYLSKNNKAGEFFTSELSTWNQFFNWRVFRSLQVYQSIDGTYSKNLSPKVSTPSPLKPAQTYRYSYMQLKHLGIE